MRHIAIKNIIPIVVTALIAPVFSSCNHKDLIFDDTFSGDVEIVFDWRNDPDAKPASMMAWLFGDDGAEALRYNFSGREGGSARIPEGTYTGLGFNSDNADWAKFRNMDNPETSELLTEDTSSLNAFGLSTRAIPRAPESASERVAGSPDIVWNDRQDNLAVKAYLPGQKLIFYPQEITCHYSVTVNGVKNMNYLGGASIDATVSGLSESYFIGKNHRSTVPVTFPVVLSGNPDKESLHGTFLTFGDTDDHSSRNILTIYLVYEDHTGSYATFDVTDQVKNAPDPHNVDIIVNGLELPKPVSSGGGFVPNVNEWQGVEYDLEM